MTRSSIWVANGDTVYKYKRVSISPPKRKVRKARKVQKKDDLTASEQAAAMPKCTVKLDRLTDAQITESKRNAKVRTIQGKIQSLQCKRFATLFQILIILFI